MKVAIFSDNRDDVVEEAVNEFIKNKEIVEIKYSPTQSTATYDQNGYINSEVVHNVLICYEESEEESWQH